MRNEKLTILNIARNCTVRSGIVALLGLTILGTSGAGQAENANFIRTENAAIPGNNDRQLDGVSVQACMDACASETEFMCKSFDYYKNEQKCDLSSKQASQVGGLRRDYPNNPYDYYELSNAIEYGAPILNVPSMVAQLNGQASTFVETDLENIISKYGDAFKRDDHVQGITITASQRLVISYSRQNNSKEPCSGMLAASSTFDAANPDKKLTWDYYCNLNDGPEPHPSSIQATGDIVIVGTHKGSRFYHVPPTGPIAYLSHLDITTGGRDSSGVAYNHADARFYAINASGPVIIDFKYDAATFTGDLVPVKSSLCRTEANVSLMDPTTKWDECKDIDTFASGQGSNLMFDVSGSMYLFSAYSSDEDWADGWEAYGAKCLAEGAGLIVTGWGSETAFSDIAVLSTIDFDNGSSKLLSYEDIGRTQRTQSCVYNRPAYRFAGGVAQYGSGLIGLWSGRQNRPVLGSKGDDDDLEFSFQVIAPLF